KRLSRKTICYSKDEEIHDNVIGMYIERYYFKNGLYGKSARSINLRHDPKTQKQPTFIESFQKKFIK
ncbi:MAG: IS1 family transposase, partial [Prevotellaceae bacterium]|nr:IS1 family transposase [Prevotellaceae bacterium]